MKPGNAVLEQWLLITSASNTQHWQKKKRYISPHSLVYSVIPSDLIILVFVLSVSQISQPVSLPSRLHSTFSVTLFSNLEGFHL